MNRIPKVVSALVLLITAGKAIAGGCEAISADEVLAAEMTRYDAQMNDDFGAMDRIIGDDLVYIHTSSLVDGKSSYIASLRSGTVKYKVMRLVDHRVRVYDCLAIMTGSASFDVSVRGEDLTVNLRFTEAWARRDGKLEFVSWQSTRIP